MCSSDLKVDQGRTIRPMEAFGIHFRPERCEFGALGGHVKILGRTRKSRIWPHKGVFAAEPCFFDFSPKIES